MKISVIGAGLAGSEAAWQLAKRGVEVDLYEMRPQKMTPAHSTGGFAELVCSNSLRSDRTENAAGLLKAELRALDSYIMQCADANAIPAGGALAVDRKGFSDAVTNGLLKLPNVHFHNCEVTEIPEEPAILAAGPLCAGALYESISEKTGESCSFFDAAAPIVTKDSLNMDVVFAAGRYGRGDDYLNCPMNEEEYFRFVDALVHAECAPVHGFENSEVFEGCMPVEVMAARGPQTLAFGPCKPVGIIDPRTGATPYAVVQLRRDDAADTLYNIVGFQTHLRFGEQKRVFSMIPGLENCEIVRYGVMHRNTYLCSPRVLDYHYSLLDSPKTFFAGQITGVEGYIESTGSGYLAALSLFARLSGLPEADFTRKTVIGAMGYYVSTGEGKHFQPMNANFGIVDAPETKIKGGKQARNAYLAERSLKTINRIRSEYEWI